MEWQPIETAPQDATPFIALNHDREVWVARIESGRLQFRTNTRFEQMRHDLRDLADGSKGWVRNDAEYAEEWRNSWCLWTRLYDFKPTHWTPLLPAPKTENET